MQEKLFALQEPGAGEAGYIEGVGYRRSYVHCRSLPLEKPSTVQELPRSGEVVICFRIQVLKKLHALKEPNEQANSNLEGKIFSFSSLSSVSSMDKA